MAETNGVASKAPLSVTASVSSADGDELRVEAGKVSARGAERYLEFIVPSADLTVRASWKPRVEKGAGARTGEDALPLALVINGSKPIDVVARAGKLYLRDERGISTEPFEDKRLGELGACCWRSNSRTNRPISPRSLHRHKRNPKGRRRLVSSPGQVVWPMSRGLAPPSAGPPARSSVLPVVVPPVVVSVVSPVLSPERGAGMVVGGTLGVSWALVLARVTQFTTGCGLDS